MVFAKDSALDPGGNLFANFVVRNVLDEKITFP
jgi:hypothetical protein